MVFIVRNSSAEENLFVFGDHEGAIGKADGLSDWSQPDIAKLFEGLCMQLTLKAKLTKLVASYDEQIPIRVNSCYVIIAAGYIDYLLTGLQTRFCLFVDTCSFVVDITPRINYIKPNIHLPDYVIAA